MVRAVRALGARSCNPTSRSDPAAAGGRRVHARLRPGLGRQLRRGQRRPVRLARPARPGGAVRVHGRTGAAPRAARRLLRGAERRPRVRARLPEQRAEPRHALALRLARPPRPGPERGPTGAARAVRPPARAGMPGNDDGGTMGAWWVLGALGMYPAVPGTDVLALGSPLFPRVTVRLPRGNAADRGSAQRRRGAHTCALWRSTAGRGSSRGCATGACPAGPSSASRSAASPPPGAPPRGLAPPSYGP